MTKHFPKGLDNRMQDENGEIRTKRGDTQMKTIEKEYDKDFGVRGDMHLATFLKEKGYDSLSQMLKNK